MHLRMIFFGTLIQYCSVMLNNERFNIKFEWEKKEFRIVFFSFLEFLDFLTKIQF